MGSGAALAGAGIYIIEESINNQSFLLNLLPEPELHTTDEVIDFTQKRYGISIPKYEDEKYFRKDCSVNSFGELYVSHEVPNCQITFEESKVIKESIKDIPGAFAMAQLIIPRRISPKKDEDKDDYVAGGNFQGRQWPFFLDISKSHYPKDRYLSGIAAIEIMLPEKSLNESLPNIDSNSNFLPLFSAAAMNSAEIKVKNEILYPWTTHGERLKQTVVHEFVHGIASITNQVRFKGDARKDYNTLAYDIYGGQILDTNHPLYASFAKVNGWKKIPRAEYVEQFDKEAADNIRRDNPYSAKWEVWDRDPQIWGSLNERKIRVSTYASYGPIHEAFADFGMVYTLSRTDERYKNLLDPNEEKYFKNLLNGLARNPKKCIEKLIDENRGVAFDASLVSNHKDSVKIDEIERMGALKGIHPFSVYSIFS